MVTLIFKISGLPDHYQMETEALEKGSTMPECVSPTLQTAEGPINSPKDTLTP